MKIKIPVGDWSDDGHGKCEYVIIESSHTVAVLQQGYKDSCKLTGISFNENEDYTGLNLPWDHPEAEDRKIAVEYESHTISKLAEGILLKRGIDIWEGLDKGAYVEDGIDIFTIEGSTEFVKLLLSFIKLSIPDLQYSIVKDDIPLLVGDENMNLQFGYGLF